MAELVRLEVDASIATVTLDSPENRNALSVQLMDDIRLHVRQAAMSDAIRALVLTATGSTFCSGADMSGPMEKYPGAVRSLLEELLAFPKPLLTAVNGHVRGGGIGLVAAADIVVAVERSSFSFSEVRLGLVPTMVAVLCQRQMTPRAASRYFLTGEVFSAPEAREAGLVTTVVEAGLEEEISTLTDALRLGEPGALAMTKHFLRELSMLSVEAGFVRATDLSESLSGSSAAVEGIRAFMERRPPVWADSQS